MNLMRQISGMLSDDLLYCHFECGKCQAFVRVQQLEKKIDTSIRENWMVSIQINKFTSCNRRIQTTFYVL